MFEAYSVGITLKISNLISPQLKLLSEEFTKLEGLSLSLGRVLKDIGTESAGLRSLASGANASNRALEKANLSAAGLERRLAAIRMGGGLGAAGAIPTLAAAGGARGRGGSGGGGLHGGNIHMGPGGVGLGAGGFAAGNWFWGLAAGGAAIYGGKALYDSAKDLNTEQNKLGLYGMTAAQNREALRFIGGMHVYGTTAADNTKTFREALGVFRESGKSGSAALEGAKIAAPALAKLHFLRSSLDDEHRGTMEAADQAMLRYVEMSGGLRSAADFNRIANFGYKMNESSGGTVNWEQLRQFKARSGIAGFNLNDDAMARLEPIIAELKGSTAGFGLRTGYNRLTGVIRIPNQVAHELVDTGIWDKSKVIFNSNGGIKRFIGNPLGAEKTNMLSTNPELFYETVLRPMYNKLGINDVAERGRQNAMIAGSTGGANFTLMERQLPAIHRGLDVLNKAKGIDAAVDQVRRSLTGQENEFTAAWTDFKTKFGTTMLPFFSGILKMGAVPLRGAGAMFDLTQNKMPIREAWDEGKDLLQRLLGSGRSYVPTGGVGRISSPGNVYLDGRKVGTIVAPTVTQLQGKAMNAPQTGASGFDGRMALTPAGN